MSENKDKFSLDDILNEYTPKIHDGKVDVDEIINETVAAQKSAESEAEETSEQPAKTQIAEEAAPTEEQPTEDTSEIESEPESEPEEADVEEAADGNEQGEQEEEEKEEVHTPTGKLFDKLEADSLALENAIEDDLEEAAEEESGTHPDRGAAFRLRTEEDEDGSKRPSAQKEYMSRDDADEIRRQILKLKNTLSVRAAVLLFAAVFSLFITVANDLSLPLVAVFDRTVNPSAYIFTNTILGLVAVAFSYSTVVMGIKSIACRKPDSDSVAALNIIVCIIAGIATLFDPESAKAGFFHVYTATAIVGLLCNTLGKLSVVRRTQRNFEFVSESPSFSALQLVSDDRTVAYLTNGSAGSRRELATMRRTRFAKDFMKNSYSSDLADRYAEKTTPLMLAAALIVALLSVFFEKNSAGTQEKLFVFLASLSGTLAVCSSVALTLIVNRPLAKAGKKLVDYSGVMLGYSSVEEFAEVNSVMIDLGHLFPTGTAEFVNLKMLGTELIDSCIMYAASMASAGKSITQPAFYKMLRGDMSMIKPVMGCVSEDNNGVSGWIENKRILLGNRALMESQGVEGLPDAEVEEAFADGNCVMYLAVGGAAAMMFAVRLSAGAASTRWLQELEDEYIDVYIRCSDGFITRELLSQLFDINASTVHILPPGCDDDCAREMSSCESVSASMLCTGRLPSFAMLIIAAKRLKFSANLGVALQYGALILGVIVSIIMMVTGSFAQITPTIVVIYNLAFLLLTILMQNVHKI